MSYEALFNLKTNPFRLTPAVSAEEIYWAGFPDIKAQFEKRIKRSMKIPNSTLVLNWGEYGSGKTHAARYFGKSSVLELLAQESGSKVPYFIFISLPKGKSPIEDFYISIIDKIDIQNLRDQFREINDELSQYIDAIGDNMHIKSVLKAFFNAAVDVNILKRYLYQTSNNTENRPLIEFGILRPLGNDSDFSKILSGLFSCLTFNKKYYSSIILWVDEFEDIAIMTKVNGDKTNSFLREILDNTPNNLLVFLNLTQSALFNIEDLGEYISEAVKSRIKQRINFELPNVANLLLYVKELLGYYRADSAAEDKTGYFPYDEPVLNAIFRDLDNGSLRRANEALGLIMDIAESEDQSLITLEYYVANKSDVIGDWKA